jgi:hypothetical protein
MYLEKYKDAITTSENINELHHILVQTCLDYVVEHGLTDIDEIVFTVDGLSSSYKYKEWTPATDSSLTVIGLETEKVFNVNRNKEHEMPIRKIIGTST